MEEIPIFTGGSIEGTSPEDEQAMMSYVNGINSFIIDEMEDEVVPKVVDKFYEPSGVNPSHEVTVTMPVWKLGVAYYILRNHAADPEGENGMISRSMASLTADVIQEEGDIEDYAIGLGELTGGGGDGGSHMFG